ncbi:MAG: DUF3791 domain-containing protein [Treponema sp.]|nr:DUF3791 domain-containing protein [Spirochaetia bacterium]MDD7459184.1 DUF3791 domain-containing protein [Spirochaetales bacterium]MDY5812365.1 DUF3791 domain-containing protein [Treponema sp.]
MQANQILLQKKYARVVEEYAVLSGRTLRESLSVFYSSPLYKEISSGISDMHCRSDKYLAEELLQNSSM